VRERGRPITLGPIPQVLLTGGAELEGLLAIGGEAKGVLGPQACGVLLDCGEGGELVPALLSPVGVDNLELVDAEEGEKSNMLW